MAIKSLSERLCDLLIKNGLVTEHQLSKAIEAQKAQGKNPIRFLIEQNLISDEDFLSILSEEINIPPINLSKYKIAPEIAKLVTENMARQHKMIPVSKIGQRLVVAMADPLDIFALDNVRSLTGLDIDPVLAKDSAILSAIDSCYTDKTDKLSQLIQETAKSDISLVEEEEIDIGKLSDDSQKPPIVKIVDLIIGEAIRRRSSDIHIEPQEDNLRVRYRIDGNLQEAFSLAKENQNAVLTRFKIMSGMDITEFRVPQDGRFRVHLNEKEIDFRVSILPTIFGGKVVMRALDKSSLSIGLDMLGFSKDSLAKIEEAIRKPFGMFLVTGPTGSGKSTTLYSILRLLNTPERHIVTIEDPVEYQVDGLTQIQVNPEIGLTFANGLRSVLRQSPDIIMVGEIRDYETADIAVKASLTGQLLLSTLHTNDASGAVTRLIDMGVEPFLISSGLLIVIAQRLCRAICRSCKESYKLPKEILKEINRDGWLQKMESKGKKPAFCKGRGCKNCRNTGYYGRMAISEVLTPDENIRKMIIENTPVGQIKEYARSQGMITLREDAMYKFASGLTTYEEVLRVTAED